MEKDLYPDKEISKLIVDNKWPFPVTDRTNKSLILSENIRNGKLKKIHRENKRALRNLIKILPPAPI